MALMLDLNITHPDVPEFISAKLETTKLENANVSVVLDKRVDAATFAKAVREGSDIDLTFGGTSGGKIHAKELWETIIYNAWKSGEPGILNGRLANSESNIWYHKPLVSTNPCGEIWLEEYGCCDLGALVLPRFVDAFGQFDWDSFSETITSAVRFLDNVLTVNEYPLPEIRENCLSVRRIGLGIMGLHSALIKMGYKYSSTGAKEFVDTMMGFLKEKAYRASIELSMEKGAFPAYDERMLESGFMQRAIPGHIREEVRVNGIRNCALLTIAPTGTTGMVSDVSTGIEPLFSAAYWRRFYRPTTDGSRQLGEELVVDPLWAELESKGMDVSLLQGAYDLTPEQHFEMQTICQNHIDNATSKTINLPENYPVDSLSDVWLEYLPKLKGTTLYRAGSRGFEFEGRLVEPLKAIPIDEARELLRRNTVTADARITEQNSMDCPDGVCEIPEELKPRIGDPMDMVPIAFV